MSLEETGHRGGWVRAVGKASVLMSSSVPSFRERPFPHPPSKSSQVLFCILNDLSITPASPFFPCVALHLSKLQAFIFIRIDTSVSELSVSDIPHMVCLPYLAEV